MQSKAQLYYFIDILEHTYDLETLSRTYFPHSGLNIRNLQLSTGVKRRQVEMLVKEGASNQLTVPEQETMFCFIKLPLTPKQRFISAFIDSLPKTVQVRREGEIKDLRISELVYGDLIYLEEGEVCPADCRILSCENLLVDVTTIKGKNFPPMEVTTYATDALPLKTQNLVFAGSKVLRGKGFGLVIAVGNRCVQVRVIDYLMSLGQQTQMPKGMQSPASEKNVKGTPPQANKQNPPERAQSVYGTSPLSEKGLRTRSSIKLTPSSSL